MCPQNAHRHGKRMVKLQHDNNKQYKVTLPKALIDAKGWKKGDEIKIELDAQGSLVLKRVLLKEELHS